MDTLAELENLKKSYETAKVLLEKYNSDPHANINIPISSVGFIQGKLKNPDEIFIYLSPELTLKSNLQGSQKIIEEKLAGLERSIKELQPPEKEPIEKIFEKLKLLEEQENNTVCVGPVAVKPFVPNTSSIPQVVEKSPTDTQKIEEIKAPARVSRFKQEMQSKKSN